MTDLDRAVSAAFHNAKGNGYSFADAEEWAIDMCTCDSELELHKVEDVK